MRTTVVVCLTYAGLLTTAVFPRQAFSQVPTAASEPVVRVPSRATTGAQPATPQAAQPEAAPQAATARSYVAGKFGLTLEGVLIGWLRSAEGGSATSEVVVEKVGSDHIAAKHIAGVSYEQISVVTDLQSKALSDWIAGSWKGSAQRKNGSIQGATYDYTVVSEREFTNALIAETTMPGVDAGSKDAAHITVKLAPEYTRLKTGSGAKAPATLGAKAQKNWLSANFRFEMSGLDGKKVIKIDSFTVRQTAVEHPVGEARDYQKEPGMIVFPNLKITLPAASAQTWVDWHEDFVVKGNNGQGQERSGAIVYLDPTLKSELARVNLSNCGIFKLTPVKVEAGAENIQRLEAGLYCERMELVVQDAVK